jgi:hypothetical protein
MSLTNIKCGRARVSQHTTDTKNGAANDPTQKQLKFPPLWGSKICRGQTAAEPEIFTRHYHKILMSGNYPLL